MRKDVLSFGRHLEDNIFDLYYALRDGTYKHGGYESFYVNDPKRRHIHKASIRDRLLHHALVRVIEPFFERTFIFDSWSCRKGKGVERAVQRFQKIAWSLSRNNTLPVWVLKLDVAKFFASIDHKTLLEIIQTRVKCSQTFALIEEVIKSYGPGLPLGNITSQLFANVFLNELDQYAKRVLHFPHYLRYCDDFVILSREKVVLEQALPKLRNFLETRLLLSLHPDKIILQKVHQGADFLGFVCFPHFRILRAKTRRRMLRRVNEKNLTSYQGLIGHTRSQELMKLILRKSYENGRTRINKKS